MTLDEAKELLNTLSVKVQSSARITRSELIDILDCIYSVDVTEADRVALLAYVSDQRKLEGASRAFLLTTSNQYMLPLRYVFPALIDRTNISRYAGALAELRRMGVPNSEFRTALKRNGGIVALYWNGRNRGSKRQLRSKLSLDRNIEFTTGEPVTLTLLPTASGVFKVLTDD